MPNPATPMSFDFSDAPGGDLSLDDIFGDNPTTTAVEVQPTDTTPVATDTTFLKTATGTVYNTAEDAVKGIEHKDVLIAELRQKLSEQTGRDPIKAPQPKDDPALTSYIENPKQYFEDIKAAKSEDELIRVQQRFVQEQLSPYAGLIASVAKSRAVEETAAEIPEITTFLRSDAYRDTLSKYPLLKQSVEISESNPQVSGDLGQLYRMAYTLSAGNNLSKIVQNAGRPVAETRPTVTSTTPVAPNTSTFTAQPTLATREGRQAIIQEQKSRGVEDLRF